MNTYKFRNFAVQTLNNYISNLKDKPEVEGVVILGGMGKHAYFDIFSDVDIAVFIRSCKKKPSWLPEFEFDVFTEGVELHFNVHQQDLSREWASVWDDAKRDAYQNGIIVFDRNLKVAELINNKINISNNELRERIIRQYVKIPPMCLVNPRRQLRRGYVTLAHHTLNNGIDVLIDTLFVVNRKFIPHIKWKLERSINLGYVPKDYARKIEEAIRVPSITPEEFRRRAVNVESLAREIMKHIEQELKKTEMDIYSMACHKYLNRRLSPSTFAGRVRRQAEQGTLGIDMEELRKVDGFINYFLIKDISELTKFLKNKSSSVNIEGLKEIKKILNHIK